MRKKKSHKAGKSGRKKLLNKAKILESAEVAANKGYVKDAIRLYRKAANEWLKNARTLDTIAKDAKDKRTRYHAIVASGKCKGKASKILSKLVNFMIKKKVKKTLRKEIDAEAKKLFKAYKKTLKLKRDF